MNLWKPLALVSIAAFVVSLGCQSANAEPAHGPESVAGSQPNMEAALGHLRAARASLDRAEHDKGGWRAAAIQATDNAIKETERGISYADKH
jgi:hypothetical protein